MVARGWPIAGSVTVILLGYLAMYLGFVGIAVLFVGTTRSMVQSLSFSGLYGGAAFAFSGAVFPLEAASRFAYVWGHLVPYTYFAQLLSEQWSMATAPSYSLRHVAVMLLFLLIAGAIGVRGYHAAADAPETWGKR